MEYAINRLTGKLESALEATHWNSYLCPVCNTKVSYRFSTKISPYFAHWRGLGSPECENFILGKHFQDHASVSSEVQRMELRLLIPNEANRAGWSLELLIPSCHECQATVVLDVGGRIQKLDMRGMQTRRHVTAELSVEPYRIVSFNGKPDPSFYANVERECQGLPPVGTAAFSAYDTGGAKGFPRSQELRSAETFALLWKGTGEPGFPSELTIEKLPSRQGWQLALVTIPDEPSKKCSDWLRTFSGLPIAPPVPSITIVWPFFTNDLSLNEVECTWSKDVLLSANRMPLSQTVHGPTMRVQSSSIIRSAIGEERSPAIFALQPDGTDLVKVTADSYPAIEKLFSFNLLPQRPHSYPAVELAFQNNDGALRVVSLHQKCSLTIAKEAREQGSRLEYLSMPRGAKGCLTIDSPSGREKCSIQPGEGISPLSPCMRLLPSDVLIKLRSALADPQCHVEIDFGGFGRFNLSCSWTNSSNERTERQLIPELRNRLICFLRQLQITTPSPMYGDDATLVDALFSAKPEQKLLPHYRTLVKEALASGFEIAHLGKGTSP